MSCSRNVGMERLLGAWEGGEVRRQRKWEREEKGGGKEKGGRGREKGGWRRESEGEGRRGWGDRREYPLSIPLTNTDLSVGLWRSPDAGTPTLTPFSLINEHTIQWSS